LIVLKNNPMKKASNPVR